MTFALTMLSRRGVLSGSCAAMAALALPMIANAQSYVDENSRVVGGVLGYLGVLPAAMILGHPESHSEATMHGGATARRHQYHLVLALFDAASGARIETARVSVVIMGLGHTGKTRLDLDPMMIADTPDSVISSAPPPTSAAADIANTTISPTCSGPVPSTRTSRSNTTAIRALPIYSRPVNLISKRK